MNKIVLQGAYGRTYTSRLQAVTDWDNGKDFKIEGGPYCSNRDEEALRNMGTLWFRVRERFAAML